MLTDEQYAKNKAVYDDPGKTLSPEMRAKVRAALDEYESAGLSHEAPEDPHADLKALLDPMSPLPPQALATSPTTTHPEGDEAAKNEWLRGDLANPNGVVIVHEIPMAKVREDLAKNPALLDAVGMSISPGAKVEKGGATEQAYQDFMWRKTADAAAKAGKTAYRYSRAPWLADGKGAGILDSLSTKLKASVLPGADTATAFVMGVDDTAGFGMASAASDAGLLDNGLEPFQSHGPAKLTPEEEASGKYAMHPTLGKVPKSWVKEGKAGGMPIGGGNDEVVGGVAATAAKSGASTRESNDMTREENPKARVAGQVAGIVDPTMVAGAAGKAANFVRKGTGEAVEKGIAELRHWNPANSLWEWVTGAYTPKNVLGAAAVDVAKAGVAGGASHAVSEAARAGANYRATGDTGTTLGEAGGRVLDAAQSAAGPAAVFAGARVGGKWVREGSRYEGLPGEVEKLNGGKVYPITGHATPPALKAARVEGKSREVPVDALGVLAEQVKKPIFDAAKGHTTDIKRAVGQRNTAFERTPEGRAKLPYTQLATTALDKTRERMSSSGGRMRSVGVPNAERNPKGIFNTNIEGVSVTPREGWIPVSTREVDDVLSPANKARVLRASRNPGKPVTRSEAALERTAPDGAATSTRPPSPTGIQRSSDEAGGAIDRGGHRIRRPERLPSGEQRGLSRAQPGQQSFNRLKESGTRFHGDEQRALAKLDPAGGLTKRSTAPGGPMVDQRVRPKGPQDGIPDAEFTENRPGGPAPIPDAQFTEQRKRVPRPQRPGKQPLPRGVKPGTLGQELRKQGIKTVYVAPRRYNAQHGESATRQLRRKGADSPNDRDMVDLHHASLVDRDKRKLGGKEGGWSKQQQENEAAIRVAKETQSRSAGTKRTDTSGKVENFANRKPNDSEDVAAMVETAKRAGGDTLDKVKAARVANSLSKLQSLGGFGREGGRWLLGANNIFDAGVLRVAYPATRAIEKHGKKMGRVTELGPEKEEIERRKARDKANRPAADSKKSPAKKSRHRRIRTKDDK